jgi:hypothetical protein
MPNEVAKLGQIDSMLGAVFHKYVKMREANGELSIIDDTCPICVQPTRMDLELLWEKSGRSAKKIQDHLKSTGIDLAMPVITIHMRKHYLDGIKTKALQVYGDRLAEIAQANLKDMDNLGLVAAACVDNLTRAGSMDTKGVVDERERQAMINDASKTLLKALEVKKTLATETGVGSQADAMQKFIRLVGEEVKKLPDEFKGRFITIFGDFERMVEGGGTGD